MLPKSNPTTIYSESKKPIWDKNRAEHMWGTYAYHGIDLGEGMHTKQHTQNTTILGHKSKAGSICATSQLQTIHKSKKIFLTP